MKKLVIISLMFMSCEVKPDFSKDGHDYIVRERCVISHTESKYGYHYGYNFIKGKYEYHMGYYTENVCDKTVIDTIEINKK